MLLAPCWDREAQPLDCRTDQACPLSPNLTLNHRHCCKRRNFRCYCCCCWSCYNDSRFCSYDSALRRCVYVLGCSFLNRSTNPIHHSYCYGLSNGSRLYPYLPDDIALKLLLSVPECSTLNERTIPNYHSYCCDCCSGSRFCTSLPDDVVLKRLLSVLECSTLNGPTIVRHHCNGSRLCDHLRDDIVLRRRVCVLGCSILNRLMIRQKTSTSPLAPNLRVFGMLPILLEPNLLVVLELKSYIAVTADW